MSDEQEEMQEESYLDMPFEDVREKMEQKGIDLNRIAHYVNGFKTNYYASSEFQTYKKRCDATQRLVNQEADVAELMTRYNFMLGLCRASHDSYIDSFEEVFDTDRWVNIYSTKLGADAYGLANDLEADVNNFLYSINYRKHWMERMSYLPVYGWSPSYCEFRFNGGNVSPAQAISIEANGLPWSTALDRLLAAPTPFAIHPYNWFGDSDLSINKQYRQGFIRRWTIKDLHAAMEKQVALFDEAGNQVMDENGQPIMRPLYDMESLEKLEEAFKDGVRKLDPNYFNNPDRESRNTANSNTWQTDITTNRAYVDVLWYIGTLNEVEGFKGDSNTYIVEVYSDKVLRIHEHPIDMLCPITHAQTHPYLNTPFSRTMLDGTTPHDKVNDMLVNMMLENAVNDAHRITVFHEDDYLNPEDFKNPEGLNTILYLADRNKRVAPETVDRSSPSQNTILQAVQYFNLDRQKTGATDQEFGVKQAGQQTATAAKILANATSKKVRSVVKRVINQAMLPEIKYLLMLALQYYSPQQKIIINKNNEAIEFSIDLMVSLVMRGGIQINDAITRDRDMDAQKVAQFTEFAAPILQQLSGPEFAVRMVREMGKFLGMDRLMNLEDMLPAPAMPAPQAPPMQAQAPQEMPAQPEGGKVAGIV